MPVVRTVCAVRNALSPCIQSQRPGKVEPAREARLRRRTLQQVVAHQQGIAVWVVFGHATLIDERELHPRPIYVLLAQVLK